MKKLKNKKIIKNYKDKPNTKLYTATPEELSEKRIDDYKEDNTNESQLPLIAEEINARINRTKQDIYKSGELLTIAKGMLPHGSFKEWINDNFDFGYNTANNMMHVYACCAGNPDAAFKIQPSILYKIARKDFPDSLRQFILDNADILEDIDNETIVDIGKRFAEGELDLDSDEIQELVKYNQEQNKDKYIKFEVKKFIDKLSTMKTSLVNNVKKIKPSFLDNEDVTLNKKSKRLINKCLEEMKETIDSLIPAEN